MIDLLILFLIIILLPTVLWILFVIGVVLVSSLVGVYDYLTKPRKKW